MLSFSSHHWCCTCSKGCKQNLKVLCSRKKILCFSIFTELIAVNIFHMLWQNCFAVWSGTVIRMLLWYEVIFNSFISEIQRTFLKSLDPRKSKLLSLCEMASSFTLVRIKEMITNLRSSLTLLNNFSLSLSQEECKELYREHAYHC